jgi:hypothetical protein
MFFPCRKAASDLFFSLPEGIRAERLNENRPRKIVNTYKNTGQIENQYRGELKYKPSNNGITNYREGRFYVNFFFSHKNFSPNGIENNGKVSKIKVGKLENSFSAAFGYYINSSMGLEFEYFDYSDFISAIDPPIWYGVVDGRVNVENYILNFLLEINNSEIIPLFGAGIGFVKSNFKQEVEVGDFEIRGRDSLMFQFIVGFEFVLNEQMLFCFRYRSSDVLGYIGKKNDPLFKYNKISNINIGFKYIL